CRTRLPFAQWALLDVTSDSLDDRFDLIICSEVLEHLDRPADAVRNLRSMLVDGGWLIVTVPHGKVHATERAIGHVGHPSIGELQRWMTDAGLTVRSTTCWGWPGYAAVKYLANVSPEKSLDTFGNGSYGRISRLLNSAAYLVTGATSLPNSQRGVQSVLVAQR
ncbi:MAG: class I SAM-dependent methyltransferase, partial [Acidimicrobiia bacterium]|nr:class I SAM-dependent methyltransferase [Acidimicrobiia bacterium]